MASTVRVDGLKELRAALVDLGDRTGKRVLNRAVNSGARVIRDQARQNVPVDTGQLKASIVTAKRRARKGTAVYVVALSSKRKKYADNKKNRRLGRAGEAYKAEGAGYYGRFLEFGTSKMRPRKFMTPAFESRKRDALDAIKAALGDGVEQEVKRVRRN